MDAECMRSDGVDNAKIFTKPSIKQYLRNFELQQTFQTKGKYNFKLSNCFTGNPAYPRVLTV